MLMVLPRHALKAFLSTMQVHSAKKVVGGQSWDQVLETGSGDRL